MQAHERRSRPRIRFGIGEEGGEPIYGQARGLRMGRLPQVLTIKSLYNLPWCFPGNRTYKDAGERGGFELAGRCTLSPREPHLWTAGIPNKSIGCWESRLRNSQVGLSMEKLIRPLQCEVAELPARRIYPQMNATGSKTIGCTPCCQSSGGSYQRIYPLTTDNSMRLLDLQHVRDLPQLDQNPLELGCVLDLHGEAHGSQVPGAIREGVHAHDVDLLVRKHG